MSHNNTEEHIDENMVKMEVNLDDTTSELLGYLMDRLLNSGANDVFYTPIYMKKNRPATMLTVLTTSTQINNIKSILFHETTTLGVRYYPMYVHRLAREFKTIQTDWGKIKVKLGVFQGEIVNAYPEYEDCLWIATNHNVPLKKVYNQVWKNL